MAVLFTYGLLRCNQLGSDLLKNAQILAQNKQIKGYRMYAGKEFPYVVKATHKDQIVGDIYIIDQKMWPHLDEYEDVHTGLYKRHFDNLLNLYIYLKNDIKDLDKLAYIEHGDWLRWQTK